MQFEENDQRLGGETKPSSSELTLLLLDTRHTRSILFIKEHRVAIFVRL